MRNVPQSDFPQSPFLWSRSTAARETLHYLDRNGIDAGVGDEHSLFRSDIKRRTDTGEQVVLVEWFAQVTDDPILQRALPHCVVRVCRHQNSRYGLSRCYEMSMQLEPRHSAHLHVGDQAGGAWNLTGVQELFSRRESLGCISQRLHESPHCLAHRLVIVDDRDLGICFQHLTSCIEGFERTNAQRTEPLSAGYSAALRKDKAKSGVQRLYFGLNDI